jgi:hypothetical protein
VEARIGLPLQQDETNEGNELDLRALEEVFEPPEGGGADGAAAIARRGIQGGRAATGGGGSDVWPLVRDTVATVMETGRLAVTGQLDSEARQVAAAKEPDRDEIRRAVVAAWQDRLGNLCGAHLTMQLEEVARRLRSACRRLRRQ